MSSVAVEPEVSAATSGRPPAQKSASKDTVSTCADNMPLDGSHETDARRDTTASDPATSENSGGSEHAQAPGPFDADMAVAQVAALCHGDGAAARMLGLHATFAQCMDSDGSVPYERVPDFLQLLLPHGWFSNPGNVSRRRWEETAQSMLGPHLARPGSHVTLADLAEKIVPVVDEAFVTRCREHFADLGGTLPGWEDAADAEGSLDAEGLAEARDLPLEHAEDFLLELAHDPMPAGFPAARPVLANVEVSFKQFCRRMAGARLPAPEPSTAGSSMHVVTAQAAAAAIDLPDVVAQAARARAAAKSRRESARQAEDDDSVPSSGLAYDGPGAFAAKDAPAAYLSARAPDAADVAHRMMQGRHLPNVASMSALQRAGKSSREASGHPPVHPRGLMQARQREFGSLADLRRAKTQGRSAASGAASVARSRRVSIGLRPGLERDTGVSATPSNCSPGAMSPRHRRAFTKSVASVAGSYMEGSKADQRNFVDLYREIVEAFDAFAERKGPFTPPLVTVESAVQLLETLLNLTPHQVLETITALENPKADAAGSLPKVLEVRKRGDGYDVEAFLRLYSHAAASNGSSMLQTDPALSSAHRHFHALDVSHTGFIDVGDLADALASTLLLEDGQDSQWAQDGASAVLKKFDHDGDNRVSLSEYIYTLLVMCMAEPEES
ncbi:unnamed protein product [Pedinophyceae sp. YPF-701]|nr:unnamed protein product [Pedinophyceae sp. YPF-701]